MCVIEVLRKPKHYSISPVSVDAQCSAAVPAATLRWKLDRLAGKLVRHAREWIRQIKAAAEKCLWFQTARPRCAILGS